MNEKQYSHKINLQFVTNNLPVLLNKVVAGMPIQLSGDDKQLLEIALVCVETETARLSKVGAKKTYATDDERNNARLNTFRRSNAKRKSSAENGKKGGRPRKTGKLTETRTD